VSSSGTGLYKVIEARQPRYFGANIIPLKASGTDIGVQVTNLGNGRSDSAFTATLAIRSSAGAVRYVDLPGGTGQVTLASGEEASLVVANTPTGLYLFDPATIDATVSTDPANIGLNYQVQLTGATPAK
jgi:hypothetical protein